jgi:hypothetical protein
MQEPSHQESIIDSTLHAEAPINRNLTFEQARYILELEPFESFRHPEAWRIFSRNPNADKYRGTGRTTAMLLRAVIKSQEIPVVIYGQTIAYSIELTEQARDFARMLMLKPSRILSPLNVKQQVVAFVDHYRAREAELLCRRHTTGCLSDFIRM